MNLYLRELRLRGIDTVVSYGCDVIQGFYFDRPLPANEFVNKYYTGSREITNGT